MGNLPAKQTGIVKYRPPAGALAVHPDTDRYKGRYDIASSSSNRVHRIAFDAAPGAMYWVCSCASGISRGYCKHLAAAGLKGRADMNKTQGLLEAKKYGWA